jgi:hypothetical protein
MTTQADLEYAQLVESQAGLNVNGSPDDGSSRWGYQNRQPRIPLNNPYLSADKRSGVLDNPDGLFNSVMSRFGVKNMNRRFIDDYGKMRDQYMQDYGYTSPTQLPEWLRMDPAMLDIYARQRRGPTERTDPTMVNNLPTASTATATAAGGYGRTVQPRLGPWDPTTDQAPQVRRGRW